MLTQEIIQEQLKHMYHASDRVEDNRQATKKWALTVWAAIVASAMSNKIYLEFVEAMLVVSAVLAGFWLYEGMAGAYATYVHRQAQKLEELLTSSNLDVDDPISFMYSHGYQRYEFKEKMQAYIESIFFSETIYVFYLFLLLLSAIVFGVK